MPRKEKAWPSTRILRSQRNTWEVFVGCRKVRTFDDLEAAVAYDIRLVSEPAFLGREMQRVEAEREAVRSARRQNELLG